jgi:hypothetical protein
MGIAAHASSRSKKLDIVRRVEPTVQCVPDAGHHVFVKFD